MQAFELSRLQTERQQSGPYLEFLRVAMMSAGLYVLSAGAVDAQSPHSEDELYYVVSGRGRLRAHDEDRAVEGGSVLFVGAGVPRQSA